MPDAHVAFALLAAGSARRMGGGKLTLDLAGRPLWRWAAGTADKVGFAGHFVVTNDDTLARESASMGWTAVPNPLAEEGLASSVRVAAAAVEAGGFDRLVVALADMPFVEQDMLGRLVEVEGAAFTRYPDGRLGVPAAIPGARLPDLQSLRGDRGAGALDWPARTIIEPTSPYALIDVDTEADLARARCIAETISP